MMARPFEEIVIVDSSSFDSPINDEVKVTKSTELCTLPAMCIYVGH